MHIIPRIDYAVAADAQKYYSNAGFVELQVPWIVGYEAYASTMPPDRREYYTVDGYLNASGEQSFIDIMLSGVKLKKNFCITPCFRLEPLLDELHHLYFLKLELINTDVSEDNLHRMINSAGYFLNRYFPAENPVRVMPTDDKGQMYDIVDDIFGIELGSYGIRSYKDFRWIYGTGVALPRLTTVGKKYDLNQKRP
jgi:aspartyl/asparaginyl-tRNA synthetase